MAARARAAGDAGSWKLAACSTPDWPERDAHAVPRNTRHPGRAGPEQTHDHPAHLLRSDSVSSYAGRQGFIKSGRDEAGRIPDMLPAPVALHPMLTL